MDNNFQLVKQIPLPGTDGGRGIIADPASASLYMSYHGDGGIHGTGSLLKYDLINDKIVWTKDYPCHTTHHMVRNMTMIEPLTRIILSNYGYELRGNLNQML